MVLLLVVYVELLHEYYIHHNIQCSKYLEKLSLISSDLSRLTHFLLAPRLSTHNQNSTSSASRDFVATPN
jgi:hypothetical protein